MIDKFIEKYNLTVLDYVILNKTSDFFHSKNIKIFIKKSEILYYIDSNYFYNIEIIRNFDLSGIEISTFLGYPFIKDNIIDDKNYLISSKSYKSIKNDINNILEKTFNIIKGDFYYPNYEDLKNKFFKKFSRKGIKIDEVNSFLLNNFVSKSIYKHKEEYLCFLDTGDELLNIYPAIFNSLLNQNMTTCITDSPSATFIEISLLLNLRYLLGYDNINDINISNIFDIGGCFTIGGMMGNILGILTARNNKYKNIQKDGLNSLNKKIYLIVVGEYAHYSTWTGFGWLGFGEKNIIKIKVIGGKIDFEDLNEKIQKIYSEGGEILAIICTLGNPYSMNFDNIDDIIYIGKKYNIWTHCDGANGGVLIFSNKYRYLINGIEKFDSISIDFHKAMGLNYSTSVFLCKDKKKFITNISEWNIINKPGSMDLGMTTPFLNSRGFESLKLWYYIKYYGLDYIGYKIDAKITNIFNIYKILVNSKNVVNISKPTSFGIIFLYIPFDLQKKFKNIEMNVKEIDELQIRFKNKLKLDTNIDINLYKLHSDIIGNNYNNFMNVLSIHNSHDNISYEMYKKLYSFTLLNE